MDWKNRRHQSYQALRSVLHAIRDRLPIHESVNFASQLPLLVKGIYYDGWNVSDTPIKLRREEFLDQIKKNFVFDIDISLEELVGIISSYIFEIIDPGEVQKLLNALPDDIASILTGEV